MSTISNAEHSVSVKLKRQNAAVHFCGTDGVHNVRIDGPSELGGQNKGFRPTELLLYALGGCAVLDFAAMLYKQGIQVEDISVETSGARRAEGGAKPFSDIHIRFLIAGKKEELENHRPIIQLFAKRSVHELCSVGLTLRKETTITHNIEFSY